jgi:predicted transcriptional regulator
MMSTAELKNLLIHRIAAINDKTLLDAIKALIDTKSEQPIYQTTPEQRRSIEEGQAQIERGEYLTNDQVEKEIDQWLKEK